jgi:hypothetical protein
VNVSKIRWVVFRAITILLLIAATFVAPRPFTMRVTNVGNDELRGVYIAMGPHESTRETIQPNHTAVLRVYRFGNTDTTIRLYTRRDGKERALGDCGYFQWMPKTCVVSVASHSTEVISCECRDIWRSF